MYVCMYMYICIYVYIYIYIYIYIHAYIYMLRSMRSGVFETDKHTIANKGRIDAEAKETSRSKSAGGIEARRAPQ